MSEEIENSHTHIGYKKCKDDRIVVLKILGDNNENRIDIIDKGYAKFRCSEALVLEIYDMYDRSKKYNTSISAFKNLEYRVGEIVRPMPDEVYDTNPDNVCSHGIHYFLTEDAAYNWPDNVSDDGVFCVFRRWFDNGQLESRYRYTQLRNSDSNSNSPRSLDGLYECWYDNGQIKIRCIYKDGYQDGPYESWHTNGGLNIRCSMKDGLKDGRYKEYYPNGVLRKECTYKNGDKHGEYIIRYESGKIAAQRIYQDGILIKN